jgi:HEAT repeat protein
MGFGFGKPDINKLKKNKDFEGLIKALDYDKAYYVRSNAANVLGSIGDTRAVPALIETLNDSNDNVNMEAAKALGEIGDVRAVTALIDVMRFPNADNVRFNARDALIRLGKPVVPFLIDALKDEDRLVQEEATVALGRIGDKRAIEPLKKCLDSPYMEERRKAKVAIEKIEKIIIEE